MNGQFISAQQILSKVLPLNETLRTIDLNMHFALSFAILALLCLSSTASPAQDGRVELLTEVQEGVGARAGRGSTLTINVTERPLKQVLDYLSTVSGINIRAIGKKEEELPVTLALDNVGYRAILDFIAKKYGLLVDDTKIADRIVTVSTPEKVSMIFQRADIRDVINTIAIQANANIVIGPEITGEVSMRLEDVPWYDALQIVVKTLDFVAVPEANDTIRITSPAKLQKQLETRIFRLAYLSPEGAKYTATLNSEFASRVETKEASNAGTTLLDVLARMKGSEGSLSFVKRSNALIVKDTATNLDAMQMVINKLDVAPKQIHVSVKIVSVNDSDMERLGVNWSNGLNFTVSPLSSWPTAFPFDVSNGLSKSVLGDLAVGVGSRRGISPLDNSVVSTTDVFNLRRLTGQGDSFVPQAVPLPTGIAGGWGAIALGSMGFGNTTALFEMIRTKTSSRIIQSPQLITLDNEEATIQVGNLIRYAESFVANTEGGGNVAGFREAAGSPIKEGLQLLFIPTVTGPENNILMTIIPKTEELIEFRTFLGPDGIELQLPQTRQRIVVTKMILRNGETGVIGGLRTERDVRTQNHLPVFSEIPILGRLFKHRSQDVSGENLMIFVTPTIVDLELRDDFKTQLETLRAEMSQPFAPLGEEEELLTP